MDERMDNPVDTTLELRQALGVLVRRLDGLSNQMEGQQQEMETLRTNLAHDQGPTTTTTNLAHDQGPTTTTTNLTHDQGPTTTTTNPAHDQGPTTTTTTPTPNAITLGLRPRTITPDVGSFDGSDPRAYQPFKLNLEMKFQIDGVCFRTDQEKVVYAYGRLKDRASQRMLPWIQAKIESSQELSWEEFKQALDQAFGDKHQKEKALVRINTMKQGGKDMDKFLAEFDETLVMAGGLAWQDEQKRMVLDTAINPKYLRVLIGCTKNPTYSGYMDQLRTIAHDLKRVEAADKGQLRTPMPVASQHTNSTSDSMDWEPTGAAQLAAVGRTPTPRLPRQRARWVDQAELDRRRTTGDCFRCGNTGHIVRNCPFLPAQRPMQAAVAQTTPEEREEGETPQEQQGNA